SRGRREVAAGAAHERPAHELFLGLCCDPRLARDPEARTGRHVRPEALPRAVLELRQRARARHSRADARGLTASERALRAPTPAETSELDRELHERLPAEVVVAAVERRVAVA